MLLHATTLAFASSFDVPELFSLVIEQLNDIPEATEHALYIEQTYVSRTLLGFPIEMWNHRDEVPIGIPRTTYEIEAWNRSYNATIGNHHPNIRKFRCPLKLEQGLVEAKQAKLIGGEKTVKRLKNKANEEALKKIVHGPLNRPRLNS